MPAGRLLKQVLPFAAGLAAALGGCGGDDDTSGEASTTGGLAAGIDGVNIASTDGPLSFTWVDTARLRESAGVAGDAEEAVSDARWRTPIGLALGDPLGPQILATDFGFDPLAGERTVQVGVPPDRATLYSGVDTDGASDAFTGPLGYEDEGEFLANGGEGEVVFDPGNENPSVNLIDLNRVGIEGDDLAVGGFEAPVAAALGRGGEPLNDVAGVAAMADCLGPDAIVAQVDDPEDRAAEEVGLQGVGVQAPGEGDVVTEMVCAVGEPGASLDDVAACMEGSFSKGGVDPANDLPYEDELGKAEISDGASGGSEWVRATFETVAKDPVGHVSQIAARGNLSGPLGGAPYAAAGSTLTPEQLKNLEEQLPDGC